MSPGFREKPYLKGVGRVFETDTPTVFWSLGIYRVPTHIRFS